MAETPGLVQRFDSTVNGWLSYVDQNEYITAALSLFLILYAAYAAPRLPPYILSLFDKPLFKLVIFFLIIYTARKNPTVAIIAAVGLLVTLQVLNKFKVDRAIAGMLATKEAMTARLGATDVVPASVPVPANVNMGMEEVLMPEASIHEDAVVGIQEEVKSKPVPESEAASVESCTKKDKYRNSFYPQYVNMADDTYQGRYSGHDVNGYDPSSRYAAL